MPLQTEAVPSPDLVGTARNPAHDPKVKDTSGRGSMGDKAFMDAVLIVVIAWLFLLFLFVSLRHHNV